jgi:hypothetical protein
MDAASSSSDRRALGTLLLVPLWLLLLGAPGGPMALPLANAPWCELRPRAPRCGLLS